MKYISYNLLIILTLLISSCSNELVKDHDSFAYSVPIGSKLILNQEITIHANLARTFFQNGNEIKERDINIYFPHCSITTNTLVDNDRTIKPAAFEIYKIRDKEEHVSRNIQYASLSLMVSADGPTITGLTSYYYLRSTLEQDIRTLECAQWDTPTDNRYLSINQIKKSLGDIFTLQLNE